MASTTEGMDKLKDAGSELFRNLGDKALDSINDKLSGLKVAGPGLKDKITGGGGGGNGGGKATKSTNIIESIDVGVPISVAYNQWTEFGAFPSFMKKVENVESPDDT